MPAKRITKVLVANRGEIASASSARVARWASARSRSTPTPIAPRSTCAWPTRRSRSARPRARELPARRQDHRRHAAPAPTRSTPATASLARTPTSRTRARRAGITFIGPPAERDARDGQQDRARAPTRRPARRSCPAITVPRAGLPARRRRSVAAAKKIGFPVMLKAAAGGGGKGMRLVDERGRDGGRVRGRAPRGARLRSATTPSTSRRRSIGRATSRSRCSAIAHGNIVHLCERDCSIQRRHQKVVEETPSPAVSRRAARARWARIAVHGAQAVDYLGAGTCRVPARRGRRASTSSR